tara:strand:+ start:65 stop:454 length:390 start_codon:yes stop_codon:yes gene_type:complete
MKRKAAIKKTSDGMTIKSRIGVKGKTTTRATNAKGKITNITKTKADGTTRTLGKAQVAARNRLKTGKSKSATAARENIADLRKKKREAKKSGDTKLFNSLRKEQKTTRKSFVSSVKKKVAARRAEKKKT